MHDLKKLRKLVDDDDVVGVMRFTRSRLVRNLGGINHPQVARLPHR